MAIGVRICLLYRAFLYWSKCYSFVVWSFYFAGDQVASMLDIIGGSRLLLQTIGDDDTPDSVELNVSVS